MSFTVSEMSIDDYDQVFELWQSSPAIVLSKVDSRECVEKLLNRNTGLSFVAKDSGNCIGAVLCSQDGRMGYLSHLVVRNDRRREGIGRITHLPARQFCQPPMPCKRRPSEWVTTLALKSTSTSVAPRTTASSMEAKQPLP